jgi:hypothetical protein
MVFQESGFGVIRYLEYAYSFQSRASETQNMSDKWTMFSMAIFDTQQDS